MIILGIDPGLAIVGYGVIEKSNVFTPIDYGVINTPKDETLPVRLAIIDDCISKIITNYKPDAIAVEELFFCKNISTALPVAHARGVILLNAVKHCAELFEYTPPEIKQAITGSGRADKKQMQFMVKQMLRLKDTPQPDDAADALAVAICHAQSALFKERYYIR